MKSGPRSRSLKAYGREMKRRTTTSRTIPCNISCYHLSINDMSVITFQNQQFCPFEDQKEFDSIRHQVFEVEVLLVEAGRFAVVRKDPLLALRENFLKV